jgi:diguanylate cyclase (GGDEF)-like protein/PAS domain S-box-containing protein
MKILIAEDVEDSRIMLEMALNGCGHEVVSCANGMQALRQTRESRPEVIISDILMPEMDGFEFCRQLKADEELKQIPFIFYTATYTDQSDEALALALGADRFVIKPVEMEVLLAIVDEVMEEHRDRNVEGDTASLNGGTLDHMHVRAMTRKLDKKIRELEQEREALKKSERRYRELVEALQDYYFFYSIGLDGELAYISPSIKNVLGYQPVECKKLFSDYLTDNLANLEYPQYSKESSNGEEQHPLRLEMEHKNGNRRWLEIKQRPVFDDSGMVCSVEGIAHDITRNKLAEDELLKLSRAVESSSSAVIISDLEGIIEFVNTRFCELTGYDREEVLGKTLRFLRSEKTSLLTYQTIWDTINSGGDWKGELKNRKKDGSLYRSHTSISPVKDANGDITHFIEIQDDMTHHYELTERLSYQASHDALTSLYNRHEFERRCERALFSAQQDEGAHALCFLDLDQFKVINDVSGHIAGDELLRQLGRLLQGRVRQSDTLARLGGDEFGILMEHCTLDQAQRLADLVLQEIQDYQFSWEDKTFRVGVSIGLVAITKDIPNLTELLKLADAACYMAKDLGRNRIHVYQSEDLELAQRQGEMQWVSRINKALEDNRFCLYAQPIVGLNGSGSDQTHYELLLRMKDDNGTIIPPGAFLTAAERYNMIQPLDAWVVKNAFKELTGHAEFFDAVDLVSINLSGPSLTNAGFLEYILEQIDRSQVEASKLCFEVTETVAISNLSAAISFISSLKLRGCSFSLDDFGSGLSSFGYLKTLPVDFLKIDGMFVKDILDDEIDLAMVKSIHDIGQVMGMQTIAEFVESEEIKLALKKIGVNFAQGFGVGKPRPLSELVQGSISSAVCER